MQRICLFPGTFDPLTLGHVDIINRALPLFDKIVVGIGLNSAKAPMFSAEQRLQWVSEIYSNDSRVEGAVYDGLTVDFCKKIHAHFILRGIETIFLTGEPKYTSVASTIVRDILRNGGDASPFLPDTVWASLRQQ
ncbi:MAG: pantetheine-phosphate adenylyltransferase [Chitinophagales bacterium]|nr:pantetheine-phosphate adenylyltransferase [Chitinophagales bacterium]